MDPRPNILFIMADQFRADALGLVGGYAKTPCLDQLAVDGTLFSNVFANSVECIPSRLSLATGLYPHQIGVQRNSRVTLDPGCETWMKLVERAGYRTALFGKTHLHPHEGDLRDRQHLLHAYGLQIVDETTGPRASATVLSNMTARWHSRGLWDAYRADVKERFATKPHVARPSPLGLRDYYDVYVAERATDFLAGSECREPWFCWVSFGGPHEPWDAPEPYCSMYDPAQMPSPLPRIADWQVPGGLLARVGNSPEYSPAMTDREVRELRANYAGSVSLLDDQIATILETVRRRWSYTDTLIVFTSDHGEMNGDHGLLYKANFLDPSIRVPLIMKPPRPACPGAANDSIVELMDVGGTILDYSQAGPGIGHAKSLRQSIETGESDGDREYAVSEFLGNMALVNRQWKAEFNQAGTDLTLLIDRVGDPSEQQNIAHCAPERLLDEFSEKRTRFLRSTPVPAASVLQSAGG